MPKHPDQKKLIQQLNQIKKSFQSVRLVFEYGDLDAAVLLASKTMSLFVTFLDDLKSLNPHNEAFLEMVIHNKMPQLEGDRKIFGSKGLAEEMNEKEFNDVSLRLDKYIQIVAKELGGMYEMESQWKEFLIKNFKAILLYAFSGSFLVGAFILWNYFSTRNHGLVGEYYKDDNLGALFKTTINQTINFSWRQRSPLSKFKKDNFSVRWTGFVNVPESGPVQFYTHSDDGVVLWIDDQKVIDNWTKHRVQIDQGRVELTKGLHKIKLEYCEYKRNATIKLFWKYGSMVHPEIVKSKYLFPREQFFKG